MSMHGLCLVWLNDKFYAVKILVASSSNDLCIVEASGSATHSN